MPRPVRIVTDPNLIAFGKMVKMLLDQPGLWDNHWIAAETGLTYLTVCRYTAALYRAGAVHICNWKADPRGALTIRVFRMGEGIDAKVPKETDAQKHRRLRRKWKREKTAQGERITFGEAA